MLDINLSRYDYYNTISNTFAVYSKTRKGVRFFGCRDAFHNHWQASQRQILYGCPRHTVSAVAKMFDWVESTLNLRSRTKVQPFKVTSRYAYSINPRTKTFYGAHIHLTKFWVQSSFRQTFATIMCRAAGRSSKSPPLAALQRVSYCRSTRAATILFLSGYTSSRLNGSGWVVSLRDFSNNKAQFDNILQSRPRQSNLTLREKDALRKWFNSLRLNQSFAFNSLPIPKSVLKENKGLVKAIAKIKC